MRRYPLSKVRSSGCTLLEQPVKRYPMSKERWLRGHRRAERSQSTSKVRRGGGEEIPLVQGKEQQLCFAGAAVKRFPMSKETETQVRR